MKYIFKNLKISKKLLISAVMFSVPIVVLLFFVVRGFYKDIDFAEKEIIGSKLIEPLKDIAADVLLFERLTASNTNKNQSINEELVKIQSKITESVSKYIETAKFYCDKLCSETGNFNTEVLEKHKPQDIQNSWLELQKFPSEDYQQLHEKVSLFVQLINETINSIADYSNIVLDPDLDSYYVMDICVSTLPQTISRLHRTMLAINKGNKDTISLDELVALKTLAEQFEKNDLRRINRDIETAIASDKRFYGTSLTLQQSLIPSQKSFTTAITQLISYLNNISSTRNGKIRAGADELLLVSIDEAKKLWDISFVELQILLNKRIEYDKTQMYIALSISLIAIILAITFVFFITLGITRPLRKVSSIAGQIAGGNLNFAVEELKSLKCLHAIAEIENSGGKYKLKNEILILFNSFNTMLSNLISLLNEVLASGLTVKTSSTQIAASARTLEATVAEQVASTNEVNATSKEISATSLQLADTMERVTAMSSEAAEFGKVGIESLEEIREIIFDLKDSTNEISGKLNAINENAANISNVITTIANVANQTNLLSLNAAIEAEKAGVYGAGFSVVAKEIRRLADRTSIATLDVENIINEMQLAVSDGVTSIERFAKKTVQSSEKIALLSDNLNNIIDSTFELGPQFEAVNSGMQQQSMAAVQISEAMEQLNIAARSTRDSLFEFRRVTEQLNEAIIKMQQETSKFRIH